MFPDLVDAYYTQKAKGIKRLPCHTNRASSLGGACVRELVYERTHWDQAELPDVDHQIIFDEGAVHEGTVLDELRRAGLQVVEQQTALEWKEYRITGHIDAIVVADGKSYPIDVKSMSAHIWDSVAFRGRGSYSWAEVESAFQTKPWLRKYLGQITLYCLLKGVDRGILLLKNKGTGALAQVNVELDYGYAESLVQRAIAINKHADAGTLPERIPFDDAICPRCKFYGLCLPEQVGKDPLAFLEEETVEQLIEERSHLERAGKDYDRVDRRFKDWAKARPESKIVIGRWLITKNVSPTRTVVNVEALTNEPAKTPGEHLTDVLKRSLDS